jgi:hypothetical protein
MDIFSVDFSPNELNFLRQALDLVTVKGTDAKFLAGLQLKLENELAEIAKMLEQENTGKAKSLDQIITNDAQKNLSKK